MERGLRRFDRKIHGYRGMKRCLKNTEIVKWLPNKASGALLNKFEFFFAIIFSSKL